MKAWRVDVKAFLMVHVDAGTQAEAEAAAKDFVDSLDPSEDYVRGWNDSRAKEGLPIVRAVGSLDTEDDPYTEEDDEDW